MDTNRGDCICEENDIAIIDTGMAGLESVSFNYVNENGKPCISL